MCIHVVESTVCFMCIHVVGSAVCFMCLHVVGITVCVKDSMLEGKAGQKYLCILCQCNPAAIPMLLQSARK